MSASSTRGTWHSTQSSDCLLYKGTLGTPRAKEGALLEKGHALIAISETDSRVPRGRDVKAQDFITSNAAKRGKSRDPIIRGEQETTIRGHLKQAKSRCICWAPGKKKQNLLKDLSSLNSRWQSPWHIIMISNGFDNDTRKSSRNVCSMQ